MAFLADELDPLADEFAFGLGPASPLGAASLGNGLGLGDTLGGMSLADELDAGPEDLGDLGSMGGMGSLALELEQTLPEPPRSPAKSARGRRSPAATPRRGRGRPVPPSPARSSRSDSDPNAAPLPPPDPFGDMTRAEADAAAALRAMQDAVDASATLVGLLKGLDRPVSARKANGTTSTSTSSNGSAGVPALLEDRLQMHLARLGEAERLREEQVREAAQLVRDFAAVHGEHLELNAAALSALLAPTNSPPTPGWTGEARHVNGVLGHRHGNATNGNGATNGFHALETIGETEPEPPSPTSPTSPRSPLSPLSPFSPNPLSPSLPADPLPQAAAGLVDETSALSSTLSGLTEVVSLSLARHAADGRTLRRARLGLKDWHEREAAEEACARGIDAWEERVARGDVPDVRSETGRMLEGFRQALEDAERRVRNLQPVRGVA